MQKHASSLADGIFLALKGLATIAEIALVSGVVYAAAMAARYWPSIGV
ncbi:MAG TPA: hypothetical protein VK165_16765 [Azonexus sp.]|nr:hypothetical protein [Azonexus sp.]